MLNWCAYMSSSKLDACCRKAVTAVEGSLSCSSKSGTCAKPSAFMYFHKGVDVPLDKCRGYLRLRRRVWLMTSSLKVFPCKSAVQTAFMTWPSFVVHLVGHFGNRPHVNLHHVKLVTVCSYEGNRQIIMTKCPQEKL